MKIQREFQGKVQGKIQFKGNSKPINHKDVSKAIMKLIGLGKNI